MLNTQVVIAGAGPTGLMLACQLERYGIDFIIIDAKSSVTEQSRALVVSSRSLEIYKQLGEIDNVEAKGQIINAVGISPTGKSLVKVNIGNAGEGITDFPYVFSLEQNRNEEILYEHLKRKSKDVKWNTSLKEFKDNGDFVSVTIENDGIEEVLKCKFLAGCDGAKSIVRHKLNLSFEGGTYENKFFLADVELDWEIKSKDIILYPKEYYLVGFFPLKGDGKYRILGTLPVEYYDKDDIEFENVEHLIRDAYKKDLVFKKLNWFSVYKLHHRCVNKFREGNVFVAGDAAHVHSPAGGQGMNTGLQDAFNLSWKLAYVIKGKAGFDLLESYNTERLPFAKWLMRFTDRGFEIMTSKQFIFRLIRRYFVTAVPKFMFKYRSIARRFFNIVSQLWVNYEESKLSMNISDQKLKFKAGDLIPYIKFDGKSLIEYITLPKFYLLTFSHDLTKEVLDFISDNKEMIEIKSFGINDDFRKHGVQRKLVMIIRPDQYIGLVSDDLNVEVIKNYFSQCSINLVGC